MRRAHQHRTTPETCYRQVDPAPRSGKRHRLLEMRRWRARQPIGMSYPTHFASVVRASLFMDRPDKTIPLAGNRPDQALLLAAVANGVAYRRHTAAERRLRNDASFPDGGDQIVNT